MNKGLAIGVLAFGAASLGGCSGFREAVGLDKSLPDEFSVVSRAPLAVPPDFALRPPEPGAAPTQEVTPENQARDAVFHVGGAQGVLPPAAGDRSTGEGDFLRQAGAATTDPRIRQVITHDREVAPDDERSFADELLFWRAPPPLKSDQPIDPAKEAQRIKEARASGKPVAPSEQQAGPAPTIERKTSTSIFNLF